MNEFDRLNRILDRWGSRATKAAGELLTEDVKSEVLLEPLRYLAQHRRDLLRPSLVGLSCGAVGGRAEEADQAAIAMVLEGYYLGLIDDVIDKARVRLFRPTLLERFGVDLALIVSVIVDAKAHHVLGGLMEKLEPERYVEVNRAFKDFLVRMIEGEALNVMVKEQGFVDAEEMLKVFERHSADIEACTRLGAIIGGGSKGDVQSLAKYGRILGTMLLINDDNRDAFNLTLELEDKIMGGSYPYPLIWAADNSEDFKHFLLSQKKKGMMTPKDVEQCVELLYESGTVAHVRGLMEDMATEASMALEDLMDNEAKRSLEFIARIQPYAVLGRS